ncbi:MAG: inositol monophosphatase [Candidatus Paceibacterota bacterium]
MDNIIDIDNLIKPLKAAAKIAAADLTAHFSPARRADDRTFNKEASVKIERQIENQFREAILKEFPDLKIIGEEQGYQNGNSEYTVVIDPLDGTGNFANGNPFFAFCAALMKDGEPVWGIVIAPMLGLEWEAKSGEGAACNSKPITVSRTNELAGSYVLWCEGGCKIKKRTLDIYDAVYPRVTDMRKLGAASIEACFVAMGKAEGYVSTDLEIWDVAAAVLVTKEAGGRVSDHSGNDWKASQSDIIFSNGLLHENLVSLVRGK